MFLICFRLCPSYSKHRHEVKDQVLKLLIDIQGNLLLSLQEKAQLMRVGYVDAEALVKRCLNTSHRAWFSY